MSDNLQFNQKENWHDYEVVRPSDMNLIGEGINQVAKMMPVYSANGDYYFNNNFQNNVYYLQPIAYSDNTQNITVTSYLDGQSVIFRATDDNIGTCSIKLGTLDTKTIKNTDNTELQPGSILQGDFVYLRYNLSQDCFYFQQNYNITNKFHESVSDLRQDSRLMEGQTANTLGYYTVNDGGQGSYHIRQAIESDIDNGGTIIILDNGLVAELIIFNGSINIKQFGAKGDGTTDDTTAIQKAIDSGYNVYADNSIYATNSTITIQDKGEMLKSWLLDFQNCQIKYNGSSYAFIIKHCNHSTLRFGEIISLNGGNIEMTADVSGKYSAYLDIYFKILVAGAGYSNVYAHPSVEFINEIHWFGGRFMGNSDNNFNIDSTGGYGITGWTFNNIGFEGGTNCLKLTAGTTQHPIAGFSLYGCRYTESFTKFIVASGKVERLGIYATTSLYLNSTFITLDQYCDKWAFYAGQYQVGYVKEGLIFPVSTIKSIEGGNIIQENTDFNDLLVAGDYLMTLYATSLTCSNIPEYDIGYLTVTNIGYSNSSITTGTRYVIQTYETRQAKYKRNIVTTNGVSTYSNWVLVNYYQQYCSQKDIPDNTDLNTIPIGRFHCSSAVKYGTLSNLPTGCDVIFVLETTDFYNRPVPEWTLYNYRKQIITDRQGNVFIRILSTANDINTITATAWKKVTMA